MVPMVLLGLVVGNSRLRYGLVDGVRIVESEAVAWEDLDPRVPGILSAVSRSGATGSVAGSVRDDLLARVERRLPGELLPVRVARRDFPIPLRNLYERPEDVGTDRLLACLSALHRSGGRGALVVDIGTAITVSAVSPGGEFLGGAIAAGARAMARALADGAPRLSRAIAFPRGGWGTAGGDGRRELIARDTESALRAGLYWQAVGGVRALIAGALAALPFRPLVIATGGDAALLRADLPEIEDLVEDLVLEGLAIAATAAGDLPAPHGKEAP